MSIPAFRPYVVSWNLTYRCNLACEHCYLDAGAKPQIRDEAFADRSEMSTRECFAVIDQIVDLAPECVTILTGGEPLLRRDILEIIRYGHSRKLWMVVGTNGVRITPTLASLLKSEGVRGLALSLDALDAEVHDRFRMVRGAWKNTVEGAAILHDVELPFIVQTTVGAHNHTQLEAIADFAYEKMNAKVWNLYFLVPAGRGKFTSDLSRSQYDAVLQSLYRIQKKYTSRMLVNAKCAPHYVRTLLDKDPSSPFVKTYKGGAGGCPAGTQYLGIRPNGDVTPCPYLPVFGGNLRKETLKKVWSESDLFLAIRERNSLGGRCGECELNTYCGGCRARAFGTSGDLLAEDPLCSYQPGQHTQTVQVLQPAVEYGESQQESMEWDSEARQRMERIPAFVRGMVIKRVEEHCRNQDISRVTVTQLNEIRSRMPASRIFGKR